MTGSPTNSWDEEKAGKSSEGREDFGMRLADLDLNQEACRAGEGDGGGCYSHAEREQRPAQAADRGVNDDRPPPVSRVSSGEWQGNPSSERSLSPYVKGPPASISPARRASVSSTGRASVSPHRMPGGFISDQRSPSPGERRSPPPRRLSSLAGRGRSISPRRYTPQGDGGRRRHRDQGRSLTRSSVGRSGRAVSPYDTDFHHGRSRSRSPPTRGRRRSPRSRYSPNGRYSPRWRSPPRIHSRQGHTSRRRPWSPPPNRSTGMGKPGKNLFISGFGFVTSERDLEKKFSRYGRVTDVRIVRDKWSGDSRGFGFLSLERDQDADAAIRALDQTEWNGRVVLVEKARTLARY